MSETAKLNHGGKLREAAARHGLPLGSWLDLSTGINPHGWPVSPIPPECWQRLPEDDDGLIEVAAAYYGTPPGFILPVAGSQAAIQALPRLWEASKYPCRVGIPHPGYAEHAHAWRQCGHEVVALSPGDPTEALERLDVLLLIHPNNPTGQRHDRDQLLAAHARLAKRGGWLVVDEAFIDADPGQSLAADAGLPGLIVLRSLGKFFGLAGLRVGFVLAETALLHKLDALLGPWALSHPARHVARLALADRPWQAATRQRLQDEGERLARLLTDRGLAPAGGTALFQWVRHPRYPRTAELHEALARQGILTRLFESPASLRFGLPPDEAGWQRLAKALTGITAHG